MARTGKKVALRPPPERYRAFIDGEIDIKDLDDEEIARMQLRNSNGQFSGKPPLSIPREMALLIMREGQERHAARMSAKVRAAEAVLDELMSPMHLGGPGDAAKIKAAQFVIERYAGKTPDVVISHVHNEKSYEDVIDGVLVDVEEEDDEF